MEEIWKDIENYEGLYQISNLGNVRSVDRIVNAGIKNNNKVVKKGKICASNIRYVCLGKRKTAGGYIWKYYE